MNLVGAHGFSCVWQVKGEVPKKSPNTKLENHYLHALRPTLTFWHFGFGIKRQWWGSGGIVPST